IVTPFTGAHRIAGGEQAESFEGVRILFAFANEYSFGRTARQLREPVGHQTHALQIVDPTTAAVWLTLTEIFGLKSNCLEQQPPLLVLVGVRCDLPRLRGNGCSPNNRRHRIARIPVTCARKLLFERNDVPAAPALRMAIRLSSRSIYRERCALASVDGT